MRTTAEADNFNLASVLNVISKMIRCVKKMLPAAVVVCLAAGRLAAQPAAGLNGLPLFFEAGPGRPADPPQFLARARDGQVTISPAGVDLALRPEAAVAMRFLGTGPQARLQGEAELDGKINYLTGNEPARWRTGIATFARVRVADLYPGISTVYYGNDRQLEYDFNVAPGAAPESIVIRFAGAQKVALDAQGGLVLATGAGEIRQPRPLIYQMMAGARREIAGGYKMVDAQTVTFAIGDYDRHLPLVIDPILSYSTYFGGTLGQSACALAINTNDGSIFMAGQTVSKFLTNNGGAFSTPFAFQTNFQGGAFLGDAFIAKFDTNYNLVYLTYLGGSADDKAVGLAVDKAGHAFVGGFTDSPNFPVTNTAGAFYNGAPYNGVPGLTNHISGTLVPEVGYYPMDGFVAELETNGSSLIYSTYLGGNEEDRICALTIDGADNAYVTGYTFSTNLPVKNPVPFQLQGLTNQFLNTLACTNTIYFNCNAFVAKISPLGTNLDYLTYFGGNALDAGFGIAVDRFTNVYITGITSSTNFPATNAFQTQLDATNSGNYTLYSFNAFVAKFDATGTNLLYSTYLSGTNYGLVDVVANGIAVDAQGAAYVAGWTTATNFPNTTAATTNYADGFTNLSYTVINNGLTNITYYGGIVTTNAFLTKITQAAPARPAQIAYSVVFGGRFIDEAFAVAVDPAGNAFVTGATSSTNFPVSHYLGLLRATNSAVWVYGAPGYNAFVTAFNTNCSQVFYSAYLGGTGNDQGFAIAVDSADTAYVAGETDSANFPTTTASTNFPTFANARYNTLNGTNDAFLAKILFTNYVPRLTITRSQATNVTLSWPGYSEPEIGPFALESNTNLTTATWTPWTNNPTTINNTNYLVVPATNSPQFFRLSQ